MLRAFDIKYQPRTSIKGQVLVDLVPEFLEDQTKEGVKKPGSRWGFLSPKFPLHGLCTLTGATNQRGLGVRVVIVSLDRIVLE